MTGSFGVTGTPVSLSRAETASRISSRIEVRSTDVISMLTPFGRKALSRASPIASASAIILSRSRTGTTENLLSIERVWFSGTTKAQFPPDLIRVENLLSSHMTVSVRLDHGLTPEA